MKPNAIILAAGTSSRFVPLSEEFPKGLLNVKGEILIERQIRQLREAGIYDITVVTGYRSDDFEYLKEKFGVDIVFNEDFDRYNNTSSMIRVLDRLSNTFICSSDNYFPENVFSEIPSQSYYSALYAEGETNEYCLTSDDGDNIVNIKVSGRDSWYMVGHVFFSEEFSKAFAPIIREEYENEETKQGYWEDVYIQHLNELPPMKINRYHPGEIHEFDSLDELRQFDSSYIDNTRSKIIKEIADSMKCRQRDLTDFRRIKKADGILRFSFLMNGKEFRYDGADKTITKL